MKIIIRADRKIGKEDIAEHVFNGKRVIDKVVNFLLNLGYKDVYIVSARDLKVKGTKRINLSKISSVGKSILIDLKYIYEGSKLERLLKKGKSLEKAVIKENKRKEDINNFGCLYEEREWNPLSKYYVLPLGKKIAFWLSKTKMSPNFITFLNIFLGVLASGLLFLGNRLSLFLFGIWVVVFHALDIIDGRLAKLTNQGTLFGKWIDGGGDKFVITFWYMVIALSLYLRSGIIFFLFIGLVLLFGAFMYNYLLLTSVAYFRNSDFGYTSSSRMKNNFLVRFFLVFVNMDTQLHFIMICAFVDKLEWLVLFYSIYFNLMWFFYFLFYLVKYIRNKDVWGS